ncbi:hypothetical protein PoB_003494800 [Plakobranchus ocellatus]|uniref:Uncharacterized protein n=1 Tax=Plakobranchus ocellatus TaxID=259542 RepID=A0AAV4APG9_9GAST|nr:hypothetical protein PoB_003494800 [Plakobranchus ocellatus]
MRREKLEHLVTTGKLEGKRSRGRQREKITNGLATWLGSGRVTETLTTVKDWDFWRDTIANRWAEYIRELFKDDRKDHNIMKNNFAGPTIMKEEVETAIKTIRKRQATFLGHVMRREKLEHLVTTGKFEGKRSRGRQREKIMDGLATWLGPGKVSDILAAVKDKDLWRDMIANAYKQGT